MTTTLQKDFDYLTNIRTEIAKLEIPIFLILCPKYYSLKISVVIGTITKLECLDCNSKFEIKEEKKK